MKEVHALAAVVHGALIALHTLGLIYNVRRKNRVDIAIHTFALGYSVRACTHHVKESR